MINLFKGHPTDDLTAAKEILEGAKKLLEPEHREGDEDWEVRHPLTYGSDPGAVTVRKLIAEWTARIYGTAEIDPDSINLTNGASFGAQNGLQQTTLAHLGYTKRAFVVSPTYFLINHILHDAGFNNKLTAIPETMSSGVDLDYLAKQFEKYDEEDGADRAAVDNVMGWEGTNRKVYRYAVYLVPSFSNPTGSTMSLEKRKQLLELARKHDAVIISDDVYDLLDYTTRQDKLPRLVSLDKRTCPEDSFGNTISNCTFSKLLGPGFRVGWQETANHKLATQLSQGGAVKSGGTPAHMNTLIAGEMLKDGAVDKVIDNLKEVFGARATVMKQAMEEHLPQGTLIQGGEGGYFFWVTLPEGYDAEQITKLCEDKGVSLASEKNFQVQGDEMMDGRSFRISLSFESPERAVEGIKIWGQVCQSV